MLIGIKLETWLTILAIVISPLLAFEVQRERDNRRERRARKLEIYRKLMMTLKAPMAPSHVDAINSIQVEFYARKGAEKKVLEAWRLYTSHLNQPELQRKDPNRWLEKKFDLLVELVYLMGQALGYNDIDRVAIREHTYMPQGYADVETELHQIRKSWLEILSGLHAIPMTMVGPVHLKDPLPVVEEITLPENRQRVLPPAPVNEK